jgi:hypothetical protein
MTEPALMDTFSRPGEPEGVGWKAVKPVDRLPTEGERQGEKVGGSG